MVSSQLHYIMIQYLVGLDFTPSGVFLGGFPKIPWKSENPGETLEILMRIRAVSKPAFLWNTMNHGSHKIFWLFRSKALQKVKKIKNSCGFRVSNLPSKFLKKSLSKMTVFISKMKWHFRISFFFKIFTFKLIFFPSKSSFT